MASEQGELPIEKETVRRATIKGETVHVVAGNYVDDPHPHVLGVYDNAEAAVEHEAAIRENRGHWDGFDLAAWWTYEMGIESSFDTLDEVDDA